METNFKRDVGMAIFLIWALATVLFALIPQKQGYVRWIQGYEPFELVYVVDTNTLSSLGEVKRIAIPPILKKDILEYLITGKTIQVTNQYPSMYINLKHQELEKRMCFGIIFSSTGDLNGIDITEFDSIKTRSYNRKLIVVNSNSKLKDKVEKELPLLRDQLRDN